MGDVFFEIQLGVVVDFEADRSQSLTDGVDVARYELEILFVNSTRVF